MASLQTGQRDRSLSANAMMASSAFIKHTGCSVTLWSLLLGILLQSVLVPGQTNSTGMAYNTTANTTNNATMPMTTTTNMTTNPMATTTTQPTMMTSGSPMPITNSANTNSTSQTSITSTNPGTVPPSSSGGPGPIPSVSVPGTTTNPTAAPTTMSMSNSSMSTSGNMTSPGNMMPFYCPSFTCNYSDCYTMYNTQNATSCPGDCYCQLMQQMNQCYTVNCTMSCAVSCNSSSQINCNVGCCNSTGCLNSSFASMMMTTSTVSSTTQTTTTTTTTTMSTMATTRPSTTANKGNKCQQGTCTGATCYTQFTDMQMCSAAQPHCQLKQETVDSNTKWTAGCTTNCSSKPTCKAPTKPPCHLECCNSTMTPCLWLNGTLNVPSSATRGLHLSTELLASLLCLLCMALLL